MKRINRLRALLIAVGAPLMLMDLNCRTDLRDAFVTGAYDFVSGTTTDWLSRILSSIVDLPDDV